MYRHAVLRKASVVAPGMRKDVQWHSTRSTVTPARMGTLSDVLGAPGAGPRPSVGGSASGWLLQRAAWSCLFAYRSTSPFTRDLALRTRPKGVLHTDGQNGGCRVTGGAAPTGAACMPRGHWAGNPAASNGGLLTAVATSHVPDPGPGHTTRLSPTRNCMHTRYLCDRDASCVQMGLCTSEASLEGHARPGGSVSGRPPSTGVCGFDSSSGRKRRL